MIQIDELRERLGAHLKSRHESQNAFARRLNIQQGSVSRFLKGETGLALEPALKILEDLGYNLLSPDSARDGESRAGLSACAAGEMSRLRREAAYLQQKLETMERALRYADLLIREREKSQGGDACPASDDEAAATFYLRNSPKSSYDSNGNGILQEPPAPEYGSDKK